MSTFTQVFLDEINTSSCLGLFKEVMVDKTLDGEVPTVLCLTIVPFLVQLSYAVLHFFSPFQRTYSSLEHVIHIVVIALLHLETLTPGSVVLTTLGHFILHSSASCGTMVHSENNRRGITFMLK